MGDKPLARVRVDFSFLLLNALMFLTGESTMIAGFYAVCAVHEIGHILTLYMCGGRLKRVDVTGLGIKMRAAPMPGIYREMAVLVSGPAVNILVWLSLELLGRAGDISRLSLLAGLYNLLPLPFLDGGALLELFTAGACTLFRTAAAIVWAGVIVSAYVLLT